MQFKKVFCVGFQKTGTSSLGLALEGLGYSVVGYQPFRQHTSSEHLSIEDLWQTALPLAQAHDAAKDTPWPILYRQLDVAFPGSKFIHVVRDREDWIRSVVGDFGKHSNAIHRLIYGSDCPVGNERDWISRYDIHNKEVTLYFAGRSEDFLSLDMSKGEVTWKNVCAFLHADIPERPWPHANTRRDKNINLFWWRQQNRLARWIGR